LSVPFTSAHFRVSSSPRRDRVVASGFPDAFGPLSEELPRLVKSIEEQKRILADLDTYVRRD
jgi:hypothetical protein